jgi:hypothetical protein
MMELLVGRRESQREFELVAVSEPTEVRKVRR